MSRPVLSQVSMRKDCRINDEATKMPAKIPWRSDSWKCWDKNSRTPNLRRNQKPAKLMKQLLKIRLRE